MAETETLGMNPTYAAYGSVGFALAIVGIPLYLYMPTFYTQHVGLDVASVGMILLIARLIDMFADPIIGHLSDHSSSKYGKRHPFILAGSIALLIGYGAIVFPPDGEIAAWWLFGFSLLMYLGWSLISVPYLSISSEISPDYHTKTLIASYREVMAIMGMMCALLIPYFLGISERSDQTLIVLFLFLLTILPLSVLWLWKKIPPIVDSLPPIPFYTGLRTLWDHNGKMLLIAYTLNALANAIPSTLFLYYVSLVLGEKGQSGPLLIVYFICGIAALPLWLFLSRRFSKRSLWIASMSFASCAFIFVPFLDSGDSKLFFIIVILSGFSLGADLVFSSSMQSDLAQSFERRGFAMGGVLFGLWGMGTKLSLALGVGIAFGILGIVGFDPNSPSPFALDTLKWLYGGGAVAFKLISITFLLRYCETN